MDNVCAVDFVDSIKFVYRPLEQLILWLGKQFSMLKKKAQQPARIVVDKFQIRLVPLFLGVGEVKPTDFVIILRILSPEIDNFEL
jgi:hypothetical protein